MFGRSEFIIEDSKDGALVNVLPLRDQILEEAEKYPYGLESDVHGAISSLILKKALFDVSPPFLVDITARHPENDNGVLMWHCGAPYFPEKLSNDDFLVDF
jgi:hypothetical protein